MAKNFSRGSAIGFLGKTVPVSILALGGLLFFSPLCAYAEVVYGRVHGAHVVPGQLVTFSANGVLVAKVPVDPTTGGYRVFLPAGYYKAEVVSNGRRLEAWIQSFPTSIQFDIFFQPVIPQP